MQQPTTHISSGESILNSRVCTFLGCVTCVSSFSWSLIWAFIKSRLLTIWKAIGEGQGFALFQETQRFCSLIFFNAYLTHLNITSFHLVILTFFRLDVHISYFIFLTCFFLVNLFDQKIYLTIILNMITL